MNVLVIITDDKRHDLVAVVEMMENERGGEAFRRWVEKDDLYSLEEAILMLEWEETVLDSEGVKR